jgi:hypothetical protein
MSKQCSVIARPEAFDGACGEGYSAGRWPVSRHDTGTSENTAEPESM